MKDLKLNDPVAVLLNGTLAFGVISEVHDKTSRNGSRRLVLVELPKEDPKHLGEDAIPEYDHVLVERPELIERIAPFWQDAAPEELGAMVGKAYAYQWALARHKELTAPPVPPPAYPRHDEDPPL